MVGVAKRFKEHTFVGKIMEQHMFTCPGTPGESVG